MEKLGKEERDPAIRTVGLRGVAGAELPKVCLDESDRLFRFALKLTGNRFDAEDLVQETWYRALRAAPLFRAERPCLNWLLTIMRHAHIDRWRRRGRQAEGKEVSLDDRLSRAETVEACPIVRREGSPSSMKAFEACMEFCLSDRTSQAIRALPEKYREIILLRTFGRYSYQELSRFLRIRPGTVMSRLHRARTEMKRQLEIRHQRG